MYPLKIIIFIFFLVFLFLILRKKHTEHFISNDSKWENYRLGDIINQHHKLLKKNKEKYSYMDLVPIKYKNSIAHKYIEGIKNKTQKTRNMSVLKDIVENSKYPKCNLDDVVLNLRVGDVISLDKKGELKYKKSFLKTDKTFSILPEDLDNILKKNKIKKIYILYGSHNKKLDIANKKYLKLIKDVLEKNNVTYVDKSSYNPDQDFIFMTTSKNFIKSYGTYSTNISKLVKLNGGKVINK